jgi:hypothetical protein
MKLPARRATFALFAGISLVCAGGSPFLLAAADRWWRLDWKRLADIGQAYGTASAFFGALAVAGVAAGLVYQSRQLRLAQVQAVRSTHRELLSRAMDDPALYAPATGFSRKEMHPSQHWFITSYVNYLFMAYENAVFGERGLRQEGFGELFSGTLGRKWWIAARADWNAIGNPSQKRFARIMEEEYQKAVAAGPPLDPSKFAGSEGRVPEQSSSQTRTLAVGALGLLVGWLVGRRL